MTRRFKQPIWIVPLVSAALVAAFGWWGNLRLRETVEGQLRAKLNSTLDANVTALEIWTTNQTRLATSLADEPQLKTIAARVLERLPPAPGERVRAPDPAEVSFGNHFRARLEHLGYEFADLVDTNLLVVASSWRPRMRPVPEAQTNKFVELFDSGQPVLITPFKPEAPRGFGGRGARAGPNARGPMAGQRGSFRPGFTNQMQRRLGDITLMQVAAPVRDDQGAVRAALAFVINPTNEFTRILSVARMGESGETYAFDQTGLLISQSRFDDQLRRLGLLNATNSGSALNLRLHDPGGDLTKGFKLADTNLAVRGLIHSVEAAVIGDEEHGGVDVVPSRDYRGVPVVAAWRWLPRLGIGVATQIDADEAFRPLRVLQFIFVILFLLLVLSALSLFVFSYAHVISRKRLSEAELKLKQLGQYALEEKIGEGGMGVVYRARHALMRRETAVKLLLPDRADETAIQRFEREVCLTCQLTHPNTIQVYDYGHTPEGTFYYAMEFLHGLNLHQLVARFGPQSEGRVIHLLAQICDSLAEAHALGLVHRDIKPANVFLCERGGIPDCVKVLDFGLVREYGADRMHVSGDEDFVGTPLFMSPESIKDSARSDPRSDLYSVGALGYYLLTGKYVFDARSVVEIYELQQTMPAIPLAQRTTNPVSPQLEQTIFRCLDKDRDQRPLSAAELRALLLTSPHAADWTLEARLAWWAKFRELPETVGPGDAGSASPVPTLKIDFGSRIS
jgi:hypothetical protein